MEASEYLEQLRRSSRQLADTAEGRLEREVPGCPGWNVADLVWHVAGVHSFWLEAASGRLTDPATYVAPTRPSDETIIAWSAGVAEGLADVLSSRAPSDPCWTWSDRQEVGFVQRRVAHETAVHAWDATDAAGRRQPLDPDLSVDGIDEFLGEFAPRRSGHAEGAPVTIHLHAIDAAGEWLVSIGGGRYEVERSHAKGDVAVRATASDLVLLLWGRRRHADEDFDVFGDTAALDGLLGAPELN